jgi:hypothetical protein
MTDTHTLDSVQPETADPLVRTAESKGVTVDRLLREMLVVYTAVELQQSTTELQRALQEDVSSESTDTLVEPVCPFCRCSGTVSLISSFGEYGVYYCSNAYCPLDTFAEIESSTQSDGVRIIAEVIDPSE